MLNKLQCFMREQDMLHPGEHLICACSGGADSVALLYAMYLLRDKLAIRLSAAHFNHHLRAAESDRDEQFVRALCDRLEIPLFVGHGTVVPGKKGLEAAAREARYAYFRELDGTVATAHTADDNAETVLMHLVRGTGLRGLGGITPVADGLIRPMLSVTRADVLAFLHEQHLTFAEDGSNRSDAFMRNRLRHHVMPLLKEENPRLAESLSAMAVALREDEAALQWLAGDTLPPIDTLRQMPPAVRSRVLGNFLKANGVREPERRHIALAERLVFSDDPSARADLPGGITICRRYDTLCVGQAEQTLAPQVLACPGETYLPQLGLRVRCRPAQHIVHTQNVFTVHTDGLVRIRSRETGDKMRLSGGTKSLKKIFIDRKIPAQHRGLIPVLCDEAGILGVYGIGENLERTAQTQPAWQIEFVREPQP